MNEANQRLIDAAARRSAATAPTAPTDRTAPTAPPAPPTRRRWSLAAMHIARWAATGLAVAALWQLIRPPRTVDTFALHLLTVAGAMVIVAWFREPSSLAVVGRPVLLPGDNPVAVQRAALRREIERAEREPPVMLYRLTAALALAVIAFALLAWT